MEAIDKQKIQPYTCKVNKINIKENVGGTSAQRKVRDSLMKHSSVLGFGGASAIAVGVLNLLVGVTHFLLPRAQLRGAGGITAAFYESLSKSSLVFSLHYWIVVALSLLTLAVIVAFLSLLREYLTGPLCWGVVVGFLGAALSTIDFAYVAVEAPRLAKLFMSASPAAQSLLLVVGIPHIDPCFFAWGLMGVFALTINTAALRHRLVPRALGYIGVAGSLLFLLVFVGALSRSTWLIDFSVGLGGLAVGPVWYFWIGSVLRTRGRSEKLARYETEVETP